MEKMKVNRKINLVEAVKFVYNEDCFEEIEKLIYRLNAKVTFAKDRHPSAVGSFRIKWYAGFSPHAHSCNGVENDYLIIDDSKIEIISENSFLEHYESVVQ